jgi:hypothetical protein
LHGFREGGRAGVLERWQFHAATLAKFHHAASVADNKCSSPSVS